MLVPVLLVGLVVAVFVLDAVVGAATRTPSTGTDVEMATSGHGTDCRDVALNPVIAERFSVWYGPDWADLAESTGVPAAFPASAFAYPGVDPFCGNVIPDVEFVYVAGDVSRAQFDGAASMLRAFGYVMNYDEVPHEPLEIPDAALSGASSEGLGYLYRGFVDPDSGDVVWLALFADDLDGYAGTGDLVFAYVPVG